MRRGAHDKYALPGSQKYRYRVGAQVPHRRPSRTSLFEKAPDLAVVIGKHRDAPTPKPSPLIGLRRSTLRRESKA